MALLKWCVCLTFLAVVLSDDIPENSQIVKLTKVVFRQYHEKYESKLKELAHNLSSIPEEEQVAVLNEYVDNLLSHLNLYLPANDLDPIEIPGFEASFKWTIFTGWITLEDGLLKGLSSIQRTGDVVLKYNYPNIKISMPLGFSNLEFSYYYEMKFMYLGPDGTARGKSKGNKFTIDLEINMVTLRAKLEKFDLKTLGKVSLKFSGSILTDWIVNLMVAAVMPILKPILGLVIEGYVVDGFEYIVNTYNHAVCTILDDCPQEIANAVYPQLF